MKVMKLSMAATVIRLIIAGIAASGVINVLVTRRLRLLVEALLAVEAWLGLSLMGLGYILARTLHIDHRL